MLNGICFLLFIDTNLMEIKHIRAISIETKKALLFLVRLDLIGFVYLFTLI
ncbi:hypothetical protein FORMB_22120 [Formosa sp. Hel1_33_131]|nr:hypothetical protein FORMB_22120 [Formosa sp. Hel1_33_131]